MLNKLAGFKVALSVVAILLCGVLAMLMWNTKFLRIMSDERLFIHYAYSGFSDWMSFDAKTNPYIAYSKAQSLFLKALNPQSLKGVVYLTKIFAFIPTALLLACFIFTVRRFTKGLWTIWIYALVATMIVLVFATTGRMVEVRPEALSIPLFCAANLTLCFAFKPNASWKVEAVCAVLFILAAWFSLRTAVVIVMMAPLYLFILRDRLRHLSWNTLMPAGVALSTIFLLILIFQFNPLDIFKAMTSIEAELKSAQRHPLALKFLRQDRLTLLLFQAAFAVFALAVIWNAEKKETRSIAAIGIGLIAVQFILIYIDPAPFLYAYSLGLSGVLMILVASIEQPNVRRGLYSVAFTLGFVQSFHVLAPNGKTFGVQIHAGPTKRVSIDFAALSTPELIENHLRSGEWHINDQISVASALCERINGKAAIQFNLQPMCIENAFENDKFRTLLSNTDVGPEEPALLAVLSAIEDKDTVLVLWQSSRINGYIRNALETSPEWTVYDQFALRQ